MKRQRTLDRFAVPLPPSRRQNSNTVPLERGPVAATPVIRGTAHESTTPRATTNEFPPSSFFRTRAPPQPPRPPSPSPRDEDHDDFSAVLSLRAYRAPSIGPISPKSRHARDRALRQTAQKRVAANGSAGDREAGQESTGESVAEYLRRSWRTTPTNRVRRAGWSVEERFRLYCSLLFESFPAPAPEADDGDDDDDGNGNGVGDWTQASRDVVTRSELSCRSHMILESPEMKQVRGLLLHGRLTRTERLVFAALARGLGIPPSSKLCLQLRRKYWTRMNHRRLFPHHGQRRATISTMTTTTTKGSTHRAGNHTRDRWTETALGRLVTGCEQADREMGPDEENDWRAIAEFVGEGHGARACEERWAVLVLTGRPEDHRPRFCTASSLPAEGCRFGDDRFFEQFLSRPPSSSPPPPTRGGLGLDRVTELRDIIAENEAFLDICRGFG